MPDLQAEFAKIRKDAEALNIEHPSGFLFITSLANPSTGSTAGTVCEVSTTLAARGIARLNARQSTPEEIQAHQDRGRSLKALTNFQAQKENKQVIQIVEPTR